MDPEMHPFLKIRMMWNFLLPTHIVPRIITWKYSQCEKVLYARFYDGRNIFQSFNRWVRGGSLLKPFHPSGIINFMIIFYKDRAEIISFSCVINLSSWIRHYLRHSVPPRFDLLLLWEWIIRRKPQKLRTADVKTKTWEPMGLAWHTGILTATL